MYAQAAALLVTESGGHYTARSAINRIPEALPNDHVVFRVSVSGCSDRDELLHQLNTRARDEARRRNIGFVEGIE